MDRFVAPANFGGDLTGSYSLQFSVQLQLLQIASLQVDISTVEICGPGGIECLLGQLQLDSSRLQNDSTILLTVSNKIYIDHCLFILIDPISRNLLAI